MSIYNFSAKNIRGERRSLGEFEGSVVLIVNTASKCGFTPQYEDLQKLYNRYKDQGLVILGFPCNQFGEQEPGTNEDVHTFCQMNYGVSFPMFEKVEVNGENEHPLFTYLKAKAPFEGFDLSNPTAKMLLAKIKTEQPDLINEHRIKWNFTKFLVNRQGEVVQRFETPVDPFDMTGAIEKLL
ncbi:glutathione peroxidase [Marinicrinis lubricantis]|uniref:Glutathione peroxidase n=1 Tax=Marinicrinis lubricantis TaxID=2086470 RepID=A0ABW1IWH9_9BACL